ncbi:MAG: UDP-N-acetylmuramate dehydrogenase [Elusimicrobiota bacterium]
MVSEAIREEFYSTGAKVRIEEPMSRHLTFGVGGPAEFYIEVVDEQQLRDVLSIVRKRGLKLFIIGAGSNLLVRGEGIKGVVLRLKGFFSVIDYSGDGLNLKIGAGTMLQMAVKYSIDAGLSGFEYLAGIPGTVGGALLMNAGTKDGCISDSLVSVDMVDLWVNKKTRSRDEIKFDYRKSDLEGSIITGAEFKLKKSSREVLEKKITKIMIERSKTQPLGTFNAGCIFKNPQGASAGKIIDKCKLKKLKIGGAYVSDQHGNFIINDGKATPSDIERLIFEVRRRVVEKTGISLELEIKII